MMGRVEAFKALGEWAMLPAATIGDQIRSAMDDAAFYESKGDIAEAEDLLDWALFLEKEMRL